MKYISKSVIILANYWLGITGHILHTCSSIHFWVPEKLSKQRPGTSIYNRKYLLILPKTFTFDTFIHPLNYLP